MICINCGKEMAEGTNFCQSCGGTAAPISFLRSDYAGFWLRVGAYVLDMVIMIIPVLLIIVILSLLGFDPSDSVVEVMFIVFGWLYSALMESSSFQGTFGKKAIGIKVTDLKGKRISFGRATARFFSKGISTILNIGFIAVAFTEKKQGIHDMISSCLVIKKTAVPTHEKFRDVIHENSI